MEALMKKAKDMIEKLDFGGCVKLFNQLPSGHPMIDLVFDRMEAIDPELMDREVVDIRVVDNLLEAILR